MRAFTSKCHWLKSDIKSISRCIYTSTLTCFHCSKELYPPKIKHNIMDYNIKVHTWWEHRIRKISISSGDNKLSIWFAHFGMLDLEDKKTQNIFAGIMRGIFGEPIETPTVHMDIVKGKTKHSKRVRNTQELMDSFREAFGD